jgi:hypothetical protein
MRWFLRQLQGIFFCPHGCFCYNSGIGEEDDDEDGDDAGFLYAGVIPGRCCILLGLFCYLRSLRKRRERDRVCVYVCVCVCVRERERERERERGDSRVVSDLLFGVVLQGLICGEGTSNCLRLSRSRWGFRAGRRKGDLRLGRT